MLVKSKSTYNIAARYKCLLALTILFTCLTLTSLLYTNCGLYGCIVETSVVGQAESTGSVELVVQNDSDNVSRLLWSSEEEIDYPLAFALIIYENAERAARLFRLIYRPHNAYCIHIDAKAGPDVEYEFRRRIADLLAQSTTNHVLFIQPHDRINVVWGEYSVLNVTLLCARTLLDYTNQVDWRYFFNANEKELPLRTNWEMVQALKAMNGSNSVENDDRSMFESRKPTVKTFYNFKWIKGSYHVILLRQFVQYLFTDPVAYELNEILTHSYSYIPDELYFNTLVHNPQLEAPGACLHTRVTNPDDSRTWHAARYCDWNYHECKSGQARHMICSLGLGDLPLLMTRPEFLANKFLPHVEPQAYDILEQWVVDKNRLERVNNRVDASFNVSYYADLYCSRSHI